jgi:ribose transport system substrate-binding protein
LVHAGADKAGGERDVEIIWKGPVREDDRNAQITVVESFIASRVDAIVLAPLDDTALVPLVREAARQAMPVVIIDSDINWDGRVSFVATDNYRGGAVAARHVGALLHGKGKVLVLRYQDGSTSTTDRELGFIETLQKELPLMELVSSNQYAGASTESAYKTSANLLLQLKRLDAIFCPNESTTTGMLRALEDAHRVGQVKLVGFDSSDKLRTALMQGELQALMLQNPFAMGELGVQAAVDKLDNKPVVARIDTGVRLATRANLNQPAVTELSAPDVSSQLK